MPLPKAAPFNATNSTDSADPVSPSYSVVQEAVEQERLRLARDLHDDLGGRLIAAKMALAPLLQREQGAHDGPEGLPASELVQRADRLLDDAIEAMREVLRQLRPRELDLGLVAALRKMADDFQSPALACRFSSNQPEIDAAPELTLGLLRIGREALVNIGKHARATHVEMRLTQTDDGDGVGGLLLDIIDDGGGYPADAPASASITQRLRALGGTAERRARPDDGSGYHLHIRIPIAPGSVRNGLE